MSLAAIVRALGGDLLAGGTRASIPGPGHGPADRSVSLVLTDGRVVVHCFAGDDWRDVLADLRDRGLVDREGRVTGSGPWASAPVISQRQRIETPRRLWSGARPLAGTLSARHLARRGVAEPAQGLRHHPAVPAAVYAWAGSIRPALLAAIQDPAGQLVGVEVTYLGADADRARIALPRKTVGLCPAGSAVRLAPAVATLLVGEGVFTCLSAARRFGLPAWALLSTRNLRRWRPPPGVRSVLIAADRGKEGEAAARELARRLQGLGLDVRVRWPPWPAGDWNEALGPDPAPREEEEEEEGSRGAGASDGRSGPAARRNPDDRPP